MSDIDLEDIEDLKEDSFWSSRINFFVASGISAPTPTRRHTVSPDVDIISKDFLSEGAREANSEDSENIAWDSDDDGEWTLKEIPGTWGKHAIEMYPWSDSDRPVTRFTRYEYIRFNTTEEKGILTDRIIASCSSYLDKSPETNEYALCKCQLSRKNLKDISILTYHHYLQFLDLSNNELTSLEPLGQLPFLMYLDVSRNILSKVLDFKPPLNLTFVNYSYNHIKDIGDLSDFWSLVHLDLSHNMIRMIDGVNKLKYLRHLNLSHNEIECLENLDHMRLQTLHLHSNKIYRFIEGDGTGLKTLNDLIYVVLAYNNLNSLRLFRGATNIEEINFSCNNLESMLELNYLRDLMYLTNANFRENPITRSPNYYSLCLDSMKHLCVLDGSLLDTMEKAQSNMRYRPLQTEQQNAKLILLQGLNDPLVGDEIVPVDQPPVPIIILVGPIASSKGEIVREFCKKYSKYAVLGVSHTTRNICDDEVNGEVYHFVTHEVFRNMLEKGEFLAVTEMSGNCFGFSRHELEKVAGRKCALVFHTDLNGALILRAKGLNPRLVLAMPRNEDTHRLWLERKYYYTLWDVRHASAFLMENWPKKAQQFWEEQSKLQHIHNVNITKVVLTELVAQLPLQRRSMRLSEELDSRFTKFSRKSSGGILKDNMGSKTKQTEGTTLCISFQNAPSENVSLNIDVQPNRVTFKGQRSLETQLGEMPAASISDTMLRCQEQTEHPLSVLSTLEVQSPSYDCDDTSQVSLHLKELEKEIKTAEIFYQEVLNTRQLYFDKHIACPGMFTEIIFTDEREQCFAQLKKLLKRCVLEQNILKPAHSYADDSSFHLIIGTRLQQLHAELNQVMGENAKSVFPKAI